MKLTKIHKIIVWILVVALLAGGYFLLRNKSELNDGNNPASNATSTNGIITSSDGSYTIEQVPLDEGKSVPQPIPNLDRPITVTTGAVVTSASKASATPIIKSLQSKLKSNPADYPSWIDLGISQKEAGDYEGAIISWVYASKLAPGDYISLANIGNLYAYFMKDNLKAESYYKEAIVKGPTQAYLYIQLFDIYRDFFKDMNKARAIIDQGLAKNPEDQSLLNVKASMQ